MNKKLYRDEHHKVLGGVCSGLADYFEMDVTIVRLLFAFTFFVMGIGLGTYIILWIVLPRKSYLYGNFNNPSVDYTVPPQPNAGQYTHQGNPFSGSNYANNANPFTAGPANMQPRSQSKAGVIIGAVLIVIGTIVLIDNFDLFPDFDFDKLWPVALVLAGGILLSSATRKQPWDKANWQAADEHTGNIPTNNPPAADESTATV